MVGGVSTWFLRSLAAVALVLAACGTEATTDGSSGGASGIQGVVLLGSQCAAIPSGQECPDVPAEAEIRVRRGTAADAKGLAEAIGEPIATIRSGADGQFEIALDPGSYVLEATAEAAMSCSPAAVTVPADRYVSETISCNTGIV